MHLTEEKHLNPRNWKKEGERDREGKKGKKKKKESKTERKEEKIKVR